MADPSPLFGELLLKLGVITPSQRDQALALQQSTGQRIGEALVALGYVTRGQLSNALMDSLGLTPQTAGGPPPPVGELLVGLKHITRAQLDQCLEVQKRDGRRLGELLVEQGFCSYRQLYEALAMQHRGAERPDVVRAPGKIRVLVVDDSPLARAFVEEGLSDKGYEVVCFEDPFTVLEEAPRLRPTIVLSDLEMPGMDGAELCRRLKDGPLRATPVIILTANDGETQKISGLRAGADDYVTKSASMEELSARIESVLRRTGETERIRKLFVRYTSDAVVDEILKNPEEIVLTGEKREATLLFADIRSFTALSESLPPEEVVRILNEVLGVLSDAVLTCGGTLDKFMGDGLMAVFGAPVSRPDDALRAMQAAEMMMEGMARLDAEHARAFEEGRRAVPARNLQLGIGVNTGPVVAGNLGSQLRTEYTCIGDAVNVAARLCALAGPGEILVGQRTHEVVGGGGRFEDLPPVRLKGKSQPVPLFRAMWGDEPRRRAASDD